VLSYFSESDGDRSVEEVEAGGVEGIVRHTISNSPAFWPNSSSIFGSFVSHSAALTPADTASIAFPSKSKTVQSTHNTQHCLPGSIHKLARSRPEQVDVDVVDVVVDDDDDDDDDVDVDDDVPYILSRKRPSCTPRSSTSLASPSDAKLFGHSTENSMRPRLGREG